MKHYNRIVRLLSKLILLGLMLSIAPKTKAQTVQSDATLGTQVNAIGTTFVITGGTPAGNNLFHSFASFSVPLGTIADFQNEPTISNILARVTGGQLSNIEGEIRSRGSANLFLMNPNGIVFSSDARLNVGGSFIGTTANAIQFPQGETFSRTSSVNPQNALLKINPSALLFTQLEPARIENRSTAPAGFSFVSSPALPFPLPAPVSGLRVPDGKSLLLVGGDVLVDGGRLNALGGRVELAGVAGQAMVELTVDANNRLTLSLLEKTARSPVTLTNQAQINLENARINLGGLVLDLGTIGGEVTIQASDLSVKNSAIASGTTGAAQGGSIQLDANTISLSQNSRISSPTRGSGNAGSVILQADQAIAIAQSQIRTRTTAQGRGGDIDLTAAEFQLNNGSINAGTSGSGNAGNIKVNVTGAINFNNSELSSAAELPSGVLGSSGNIEIKAGSLSLENGAGIISSNTGDNAAGNVTLQVREQLSLTNKSRISSETFGRGTGGNIEIDAQSLSLTDSAIRSATLGAGNAGNIRATLTESLNVRVDDVNNLQGFPFPIGLSTSTNSAGQGGKLEIIANRVDLRGKPGIRSGLFAAATGSGAGGEITIDAPDVNVDEGAVISVSSTNPRIGQAGNLGVLARSVTLNNQAQIISETASGNGGNILLQLSDSLVLRRNSLISTTAGTAQAGGNGGNIAIAPLPGAQRRPFLIAVPAENSDIKANAFTGNGGRVTIDAEGLFGIQAQPLETPESGITAISRFGVSGTVTVTTPDVDPRRGLVELPATVLDASNQIAQACAPRGGQASSFVATGRGGLPLNPREPLRGRSTITEWVSVNPNAERDRQTVVSEKPAPHSAASPQPEIVEARGWVKDANGRVVLVAQAPVASPATNSCLAR